MRFMSNQTEFQQKFPRQVTQVVKITFNEFKKHNMTRNMTRNMTVSVS